MGNSVRPHFSSNGQIIWMYKVPVVDDDVTVVVLSSAEFVFMFVFGSCFLLAKEFCIIGIIVVVAPAISIDDITATTIMIHLIVSFIFY
jgi:hypothetical protein